MKFGDEKQITARRFLEEVEKAKEMVLACEEDHVENLLKRFDEGDISGVRGHIFATQEEIHGCSCMPRISSEALLEVARILVNEKWPW